MTYKKSQVDISSKEMVVAQILLLIVLGCLIFLIKWSLKDTNSNMAYLELQVNGQRRAFEGRVGEEMTLLDALYLASRAGNIDFKYTPQPQANASILQLSGIGQKEYEIYLNSIRVSLDRLNTERIRANYNIIVKAIESNN